LTEQLRKTSRSTGLSMDLIYGIAAIKIIFFWSNCMASWTSWIDTVYKTVTYITTCAHIYSITGYNANAHWILKSHIEGGENSQVCFLQFFQEKAMVQNMVHFCPQTITLWLTIHNHILPNVMKHNVNSAVHTALLID
jgi:hypothetical protein